MTKAELLQRMTRCPKWDGCNAPICPLDDDWRKSSMQPDEPVCFYLSEYVKDGAEARFQAAGASDIYRRIGEVLPNIQSSHGRIRRALERAVAYGSRLGRKIGR